VTTGVPELSSVAREVCQLAVLTLDLNLMYLTRRRYEQTDAPALSAASARGDEAHAVQVCDRTRLANRELGRLHGERVARASSVAAEIDPALEELVEERPDVSGADAAEIEPLREANEVTGEAVAADVARLPDPILLGFLAQAVVQRTPVAGTAAVPLPVGANDEEWMVDRLGGRCEVKRRELLQVIHFEPAEAGVLLGRASKVDRAPLLGASLRPPDEEQAGARERVELLAQHVLDAFR
jgi:hypothetical protein